MGTVVVRFIGVCTHFTGIVPGVPHRVVLPDASAFRFGIAMDGLESASTPDRATYFLMPHFSVLRICNQDLQQSLSIAGVMEAGNVFTGVRLMIPNALHNGMTGNLDRVPQLTSYVEEYAYSPEVVLGGHAAVYFDLFSGEVRPFPEDDQAIDVSVAIETTGPPELLVTPFFGGGASRFPLVAEGQDPDLPVELCVANQGMDCDTQENSFDFLLHYLTNRKGIPRRLVGQPPGLVPMPAPFGPLTLDAAANTLKTFDFPTAFNSPCLTCDGLLKLRRSYVPGEGFHVTRGGKGLKIVSVACSNSQYP